MAGEEEKKERFPHEKSIIDMDSLHKEVAGEPNDNISDQSEIRFCNRCSTIIQDGIWCEPCAEAINKSNQGE